MTHQKINNKFVDKKKIINSLYLSISIIFLFIFACFYSSEIKQYVTYGLSLCVEIIIPSVFPFMIFSDVLLSLAFISLNDVKSNNAYKALTFVCGFLCGFPIAAVISSKLYSCGIFNKRDCESICALGSIPSLSFCVGGIGEGMLESKIAGIFIWLACLLSSLVVYFFHKQSKQKIDICINITKQKYSFVDSVSRNAFGILKVCAFITIFSVICGCVKRIINNDLLACIFMPFFEVSNACFLLSNQDLGILKIPLIAFASALSGASVFCQVMSVFDEVKPSKIRYIYLKILQALISFIFALIAILLLKSHR